MRALALAFLLSAPAQAAPLDAAGFEARVTGRTFDWARDGAFFGAEQYLEGRKVRWVDGQGRCVDGTWAQFGEMICFTYDGPPVCWTFFDSNRGLEAHLRGQPANGRFRATRESTVPLACTPRVGV